MGMKPRKKPALANALWILENSIEQCECSERPGGMIHPDQVRALQAIRKIIKD